MVNIPVIVINETMGNILESSLKKGEQIGVIINFENVFIFNK